MPPKISFKPEFTEFIPGTIEDGVLYVSIPYATATHKCACGCGSVVVTPLSETDWSLTFNRDAVSLNPSIGNWSFDCQSHYWIIRNKVRWASKWSKERIAAGRAFDAAKKNSFYDQSYEEYEVEPMDEVEVVTEPSFWKRWLRRLIGK